MKFSDEYMLVTYLTSIQILYHNNYMPDTRMFLQDCLNYIAPKRLQFTKSDLMSGPTNGLANIFDTIINVEVLVQLIADCYGDTVKHMDRKTMLEYVKSRGTVRDLWDAFIPDPNNPFKFYGLDKIYESRHGTDTLCKSYLSTVAPQLAYLWQFIHFNCTIPDKQQATINMFYIINNIVSLMPNCPRCRIHAAENLPQFKAIFDRYIATSTKFPISETTIIVDDDEDDIEYYGWEIHRLVTDQINKTHTIPKPLISKEHYTEQMLPHYQRFWTYYYQRHMINVK